MRHADFAIGKYFTTASGLWLCTDVGTRAICAIKQVYDDPSWMNGPPYAVVEIVFDEYDFGGCHPAEWWRGVKKKEAV